MPLGPVFRHEMLAAGRKRRYFWARVLVGLGMLALLAVGYQFVVARQGFLSAMNGDRLSISGMAQLTAAFYAQFAWATMLGVLAITPAVAAGAIASERERRTIEYLFATDLSNAEIVLDKLVARLLTVGKLVLATLPVLAIFRLLGGVPGTLLMSHFAMLASTATLAASIALTTGVWCERARDAVPRALGAVFLWLISLPLAFLVNWQLGLSTSAWAEWLNLYVVGPIIAMLTACHPIMVLATSAGVGGGVLGVDLDLRAIAIMVGLQLVFAAALLAVCVAVVRRVHLNAASAPGTRANAAAGAPASRSPFERRPMLWKELFAASIKKREAAWRRALVAVLLVLAAGGPLVVMLVGALVGYLNIDFEEYMGTATGMACVCGSILLLLVGSRAAGLISHERERDTWLSLLTTDLSAGDIVAAKTWGNLYAFRWPMLGVVLMPLLGALLDVTAVASTLGVVLALSVIAWAATAIGIAASLRMTSSTKAVGVATFVLLAIGGFYAPLAMTFAALAGIDGDAVAVIALPPLAPLLLAVPMVAGFDQLPDEMIIAYGAGVLFYTFLGFAVTASNVARFDTICGRGAGAWGPQPATPSAARVPATGPAPALAEEARGEQA